MAGAGVVGIADTGLQEVTNTAILGIGSQISASDIATQAVTTALAPPTNDLASAKMCLQHIGNAANFSMQLQAGMAQLAQRAGVIGADNIATQAADGLGAAAMSTIPV